MMKADAVSQGLLQLQESFFSPLPDPFPKFDFVRFYSRQSEFSSDTF